MIVLKHSFLSSMSRRHGRTGSKADAKDTIRNAVKHVSYISQRPGSDREGAERSFFTTDREGVNAAELKQKLYDLEGRYVVVHKFMFSPDIELRGENQHIAYVRLAMETLGSIKGLDLDWYATMHGNTEHPHVHLVLLGEDAYGRQVKISKRDHQRVKDTINRYLDKTYPLERLQKQVERNRSRAPTKNRVYELMLDRKQASEKDSIERQALIEGGVWSFELDERQYSYSYNDNSESIHELRSMFSNARMELRGHDRRLRDLGALQDDRYHGSNIEREELLAGKWFFSIGEKRYEYSFSMQADELKDIREDLRISLQEREVLKEHEKRLGDIARLQRNAFIDERLANSERSWLFQDRPLSEMLFGREGVGIDPSSGATMWMDQSGGMSGGLSERQMAVGELTKEFVGFVADPDASAVEPMPADDKETLAEKFLKVDRDETISRLVERLAELVNRDKLLAALHAQYKQKDNKEAQRLIDLAIDVVKQSQRDIDKQKHEQEKREREQKRKPRELDIFDWDDPDWE